MEFRKLKKSIDRLDSKFNELSLLKDDPNILSCLNKNLKATLMESTEEATIYRFNNCMESMCEHLRDFLHIMWEVKDPLVSNARVIKTASEKNLITKDKKDQWERYLGFRNKLIHRHDKASAQILIKIIDSFIDDTRVLYKKISGKQYTRHTKQKFLYNFNLLKSKDLSLS